MFIDCGCCVVDALQQIATTMGSTYWKFNGNSCQIEMVGMTPDPPRNSESSIACDCNLKNSTACHVVRMYSSLILLLIIFMSNLPSYA
jgi:hypothetical protein